MSSTDIGDLQRRMDGAIASLAKEYSGLRTGRASTSLLDSITVDAYGSKMPLSQVGTVGAPEPRLLTVQVWDQGLVQSVEKAIRESELGLNPASEGQVIRVPLPELSEERRKELVKVANKYAEDARISIRNVRRSGMDTIKKMEKDGEISKDDAHQQFDEIQKITDQYISKIDTTFSEKEKDIMQV